MTGAIEPRPFAPRQGTSGGRSWLGASFIAIALHAAVGATLLTQREGAASEETLGAMAIQIGFENVAPSFDASEIAESPDTPTTTATTAAESVSAPREERPSEPVAQVAEAGDQPVVPEPTPQTEERRETEAQSSAAAAASSSGAAPSRVAERESTQSTATAIGSSAEAQRARAAWQRGLMAHIERHKRAPGAERAVDIVVDFSIDRQGRLLAVEIVKGSGDTRYDRAAIDMVRRADPMPMPPPDQHNLSFRIPIAFRMGD